MSQINSHVFLGVKLTTDQLSDQELAALYLAISAGFNPKNVMGYEKAKSLFTASDGTEMRTDTEEAFATIVSQRIK